jgi:universal stress protein E
MSTSRRLTMNTRTATAVKKVLVAGDAQDALLRAVEKAATIEHYTGASVTVLLVLYDPVTEILIERYSADVAQRIIDDLVRNELKALETALAPYRSRIADLEAHVVFARDTAAAIVTAASDRAVDLIVKPLGRSAHLADFLHTPLDWQLMRAAPCPVLFTRTAQWLKPIRVLVALDVMDRTHVEVNERLLEHGKLAASILGGELHVATAYPSVAPYVTQYQVAQDQSSIKVQLREQRFNALTRLLGDRDVVAAAVHVEEGRPRDVVRALASQLRIGLVVIGTAGRSGIGKLLIGNTAEEVVSDLTTDLLTVRARSS